MIYLATPYSHPDESIRHLRYEMAVKATAILMQNGHMVFSPIAHSHPIACEGELPGDFEYWREFDRRILSVCDYLLVVQLHGWHESKGIAAEISIAHDMGIEIDYLEFDDLHTFQG